MEQVPKIKFSFYDMVVTNKDLPGLPKNSPGIVMNVHEDSIHYEVEFFPEAICPRSTIFILPEDMLTLQNQ